MKSCVGYEKSIGQAVRQASRLVKTIGFDYSSRQGFAETTNQDYRYFWGLLPFLHAVEADI